MRVTLVVVLSVMLMAGWYGMVVAGSLEPTGPPTAGSGMYTLQNLYDYLTSGAALTVQTSFQEPTSAPGSTMKTTKEIGDGVQALFTQCPATAADVKSGVKFFSTVSGSWGVQTGTLVVPPTPTITPTITPTPTPWCTAMGGLWADLNDGTSNLGCWFKGNPTDESCTAACIRNGLLCSQTNWNDDPSCTIGLQLGCTSCRSTCVSDGTRPQWAEGGQCQVRCTATAQDCSAIEGAPRYRYCVCKQP